ncbi:MAG: serine hydrolase [Acidobacteriota bacterium]
MTSFRIVVIAALLCVACGQVEDPPVADAPSTSNGTETSSSNINAALDSFADDEHDDLMSVFVLHDGELVAERFFNDADEQTLVDVRSAGKSVTSLLVGIAMDQGAIASLDDRVEMYWPESEGSPIGSIQLKDLLTMRTGLAADANDPESPGYEDFLDASDDPLSFPMTVPVWEEPGTRYRYNSLAAYVAGVVIERATERGLEDFAREFLFEPLGIESLDWQEDRSGQTKGQGNLFLTGRGLNRIGEMVLNDGMFNGQQVVSAEWLEESLKPRVDISDEDPFATDYGYYWYRQTYPVGDRTVEVFFASGNGGNKIYVMPDLDMVVSIQSRAYGQGRGQRRSESILKAILATQS